MKRALLITAAVFLFANVARSQVGFQWVQAMGKSFQQDEGRSIAVDANGNAYVTGFFSASVDFDNGPGVTALTSAGGFDIFVAKYNPAGVLMWAVNMGGTGDDQANAIYVNASGDVFI